MAGEQPFDLAVLRDAVGDDPARLRRYVELFVSQTRGGLDALEAAIAAGDRLAVRLAAHRLAGSSALVGARAMAATAGQLELRAGLATPEELAALAARLAAQQAEAASCARTALDAACPPEGTEPPPVSP